MSNRDSKRSKPSSHTPVPRKSSSSSSKHSDDPRRKSLRPSCTPSHSDKRALVPAELKPAPRSTSGKSYSTEPSKSSHCSAGSSHHHVRYSLESPVLVPLGIPFGMVQVVHTHHHTGSHSSLKSKTGGSGSVSKKETPGTTGSSHKRWKYLSEIFWIEHNWSNSRSWKMI